MLHFFRLQFILDHLKRQRRSSPPIDRIQPKNKIPQHMVHFFLFWNYKIYLFIIRNQGKALPSIKFHRRLPWKFQKVDGVGVFSEEPETGGGRAINYVVYFADFATVRRFSLQDWEEVHVWLRLEGVDEVVWEAFLALLSVICELVNCHVFRHGFDLLLQLTGITVL